MTVRVSVVPTAVSCIVVVVALVHTSVVRVVPTAPAAITQREVVPVGVRGLSVALVAAVHVHALSEGVPNVGQTLGALRLAAGVAAAVAGAGRDQVALRVHQVVRVVRGVPGVRRRWRRGCLVPLVILVSVLVLSLLVAVRVLAVLSLVPLVLLVRWGVLVVAMGWGMAMNLIVTRPVACCVALGVALQVRVGAQPSAELLVAVAAQSLSEFNVVRRAPGNRSAEAVISISVRIMPVQSFPQQMYCLTYTKFDGDAVIKYLRISSLKVGSRKPPPCTEEWCLASPLSCRCPF